MVKVIFECYENKNEFQEEVEFEDGTTDREIEAEWAYWVWGQAVDNYGWRRS